MNRLFLLSLLILIVGCDASKKNVNNTDVSEKDVPQGVNPDRPLYAIAIHGGAGTITRSNLSKELEQQYKSALEEALNIGENILQDGGTALEAVRQTINYMEDSPLFNAGKGAVFTHNGKNELDASIMDGDTQNAGAVGGVTVIKNPINAAIALMEKSPHVFMVGNGAEQFAKEQQLEIVDPSYFYTEQRFNSLQKALKNQESLEIKKRGTVGCVALDQVGNIVAGTSTGGMTNKQYGRVGDSPIIGAGTYADNKTCGVSATGHGEYFIRYTVARDIAALMEYGGKTLKEASEYIIHEKLVEKGGDGGIIAIDKNGNIEMPFNTEGMYRGWAKEGKREILIYK